MKTYSHSPFLGQPNLDDNLRKSCWINQIFSFQEMPSGMGETWCNHLHTVCERVCESTLHHEISRRSCRKPELMRVDGGCLGEAGISNRSKCLSYHTHMHKHNVTDTFPQTAMMNQADSCRKLLASSQPHFSSNGYYLSYILPIPVISACLVFFHPPFLHPFGVSFFFPHLHIPLSAFFT